MWPQEDGRRAGGVARGQEAVLGSVAVHGFGGEGPTKRLCQWRSKCGIEMGSKWGKRWSVAEVAWV